jgi:hypothetical protein
MMMRFSMTQINDHKQIDSLVVFLTGLRCVPRDISWHPIILRIEQLIKALRQQWHL